jgi:glycosyltransferase involved in cell wall biosynthesis
MTLKIMWLHSHITNASGSSKYLYNILKQISSNYEITLFIQKPITFLNEEFQKLPIKIITLGNSSTSDLKFWFNFLTEINKQKSFLKKQSKNFDLVISSFFPMNIIADDLGLKHLQFCFQPYAFFWDDELIESLPFFKRILLKYYKKQFSKLDFIATKNSSMILTINEGSRISIEKIYRKNSIPTFMGIDIEKTESIKHQLNLKNSKILIHSTDWSSLKNTFWLIKQFSNLQHQIPNTILMITETNVNHSEKNKAIKLIKENNVKNVKFLGTLSKIDYVKYLSSADVVIFSGSGSGITTSLFVLECMSLGITALVTNQVSEDVIHGITGYIYKNNNDFAENLIKILENDDLRHTLGNNAKKYVSENHSWVNAASIFDKQISKLIDK